MGAGAGIAAAFNAPKPQRLQKEKGSSCPPRAMQSCNLTFAGSCMLPAGRWQELFLPGPRAALDCVSLINLVPATCQVVEEAASFFSKRLHGWHVI